MTAKVYRDGKWESGKASPENLREDLRKLPGDLVTKDIGDETRVHELDAPHIAHNLQAERVNAYKDAAKPTKKKRFMGLSRVGERKKLNQRDINWARLRVHRQLVTNAYNATVAGQKPDWDVHYLWFPKDEVNMYSLRKGNPPPDIERPKHMRGYNLWIDPLHIPPEVGFLAKEAGWDIEYDMRSIRDRILVEPEPEPLIVPA